MGEVAEQNSIEIEMFKNKVKMKSSGNETCIHQKLKLQWSQTLTLVRNKIASFAKCRVLFEGQKVNEQEVEVFSKAHLWIWLI